MVNQKKELVETDFYQCIGNFQNCKLIFNNKDDFKILDTDTEEIKRTKQGQKEAFLSQLGIVGEKALKYIFGIKLLNITNSSFQNKNLEEFDSYFRGSNARLNELANILRVDINTLEYQKILQYEDDNKQKAHNFDYWYNIVNLFLNNYMDTKFKKYLFKKKESDSLLRYCKNNNAFYTKYYYPEEIEEPTLAFRSIFDSSFSELVYNDEEFPKKYIVTKEELDMLKQHKSYIIKEAGDSFVRFRYAFNNVNNTKELNIEDVYYVIEDLTGFIKYIHENNNNLDFDLDKEFARNMALKLHKKIGKSEEEINNIFSFNLNYECIEDFLLYDAYSIKYIENLIKLGIPREDLSIVVNYRLSVYDIKYFFQKGITNYDEMYQAKLDYLNSFEENNYYRK